MAKRLLQLTVWLLRIGYCRGFGIQSPTDYAFTCKVLNGRRTIRRSDLAVNADWLTLKLCNLYSRISTYLHPQTIVDYQPPFVAYTQSFLKGCPSAIVLSDSLLTGCIDLLRVNADEGGKRMLYASLDRFTNHSVVIVEGIYRNRRSRLFWHSLLDDDRFRITFDLYYAGIVFMDSKRYKQNYKINF